MKPLFSVIIPTLNEEKFLPLLLSSLVNQSQSNFEAIIIDANSHDKTIRVAKSFQKRIPALKIVSVKTANPGFQRNMGVKHAQGEWLVFVDADTVLFPNFFHKVQQHIAAKNIVFFTTWLVADEKGLFNVLLSAFMNLTYEFLLLIGRPMAPGPLTVIRNDTFHEIGQYDESREYGEDYDLSLRGVKKRIRFHVIREILHRMSFRRMRKHGYMSMSMLYIRTTLEAALTGKVTPTVAGYVTGGHLYHS